MLGLIATPYIISKVGINGFGVWALMESIMAYFRLSDMGVGASFTKHIAEYHAKKEYNNLSRVVSAGSFVLSHPRCFYFSLSLILKDWILTRFDFSIISMGDVSFIYLSLCGGNVHPNARFAFLECFKRSFALRYPQQNNDVFAIA